jgi:signal transduction histidine kinase
MTLSTPAPATETGHRTDEHSRPPRRYGHTASALAATRRRLVAINLLVVTAILALMAVAVYVAEAHAIDQQLNQQLADRARHDASDDAVALVTAPPGVSAASQPRDAGDALEHYEPASPNVFALVFDKNGRLILDPGQVSTQVPPDQSTVRAVLAGTTGPTFTSANRGAHDFRLYTMPLRSHDTIVGALQVGTSLDARDRQLRDLLLTLGLVGVGVLVLTAGASIFLAERALVPTRRAFERQRQFAAAASHELRTPLAIARSQADLVLRRLRREGPLDRPSVAGDVEEIVAEVDYMTRLVRELLLLVRDEHDPEGLLHGEVDLRTMVDQVVDKLRPTADELGLTLCADVDTAAPPYRVRGDADRLRQCVLILLENALQYTPHGGRVAVTLRHVSGPRLRGLHPGHVELLVSDTGPGVPPEEAERIFEPFFRGSAGRRSAASAGAEQRGAGLGLALAHWIVVAHGGAIGVDPGPDRGSVFTVTLPAFTSP